jgi:hypothetical protein
MGGPGVCIFAFIQKFVRGGLKIAMTKEIHCATC